MVEQIEVAFLGISVVIDSVLLMILLERVNRLSAARWLHLLVGSTWIVHSSGFCHVLIRNTPGLPFEILDRLSLSAMGIALLLMPSAMLHAAIRLNHTGHVLRQRMDYRYGWLYVPLLVSPWIVWQVFSTDDRTIPGCFGATVAWYVLELGIVNVAAGGFFLRYRASITGEVPRGFFLRLAISLALVSLITTSYVIFSSNSIWEPILGLFSVLAPLSFTLLFLWYAMRERIVPLAIERSLAYGAIFVLVIFVHQVWVVPLGERMQHRSNLDIILIEGIGLIGLILIWRPLRQRMLESLRYLIGHNIFRVRESLRQLSLQVTQQDTRSLKELQDWFLGRVADVLEVEKVEIWFQQEIDGIEPPGVEERARMEEVLGAMHAQGRSELSPGDIEDLELASRLQDANYVHFFCCQFKDLHGLVLLCHRRRNERFSEEQRASITMLFDQYTATVSNRILERERLQRERQASQQEKLAVLGLMAGSLAHEIKNPLSSIRTIATLLREDLGLDSVHSRDLQIILEEIDRLTSTTQRLLDYSKPPDEKVFGVSPQQTILRLMHILGPWAKQQQVTLIQELGDQGILVHATDAGLSEVMFNMLRNAIEAAQGCPSATVWISTYQRDRFWIASIRDNGPGIDPAIRETIYEPFVSSKQTGTGLGLYVAAERVRSMRGTIQCNTSASGTTFEVWLPIQML